MTGSQDPRFRRLVERIHALGTRALGALFLEANVDQTVLDTYAALDPNILHALGADLWPVTKFSVSTST